MVNLIKNFESEQLKIISDSRSDKDFDLSFKPGDTVKVKYKITEGGNTRLQAFIGVVISKNKSFDHYSSAFTVRKVSAGIGVERRFPVNSPLLSSIEVVKKGVVRRAKLYYLRDLKGKSARIKEKLDFVSKQNSSN